MKFAARETLAVLRRPVRNDFEILARRARRDGSIALRLKAPARGAFRLRAFARPAAAGGARAKRPIRYVGARRFAERAGKLKLRARPTHAGRRALREHERLRVSIAVSFRPVGGEPRSKRTRLAVGQR